MVQSNRLITVSRTRSNPHLITQNLHPMGMVHGIELVGRGEHGRELVGRGEHGRELVGIEGSMVESWWV